MRTRTRRHPWNAQFVRYVRATGEQQVWSYDNVQMQPDSYGNADYAHAGTIDDAAAQRASPSRPKPRAAIYALGEAASKTIGGSTSRVGADLSIPITPTASFYSTFHPDYSNVELDQQSISPTVYQRYYSEVRPFFTQARELLQQFNCDACPNIQALYTPAIPTPREGYAVEGKQGPFGFATFDARAATAATTSRARSTIRRRITRWYASVQRVSVNTRRTSSTTSPTTGIAYSDLKHISSRTSTTAATPAPTCWCPIRRSTTISAAAGRIRRFGFFGSMRKIGEYYNPADGFISHPGIAGYALYTAKIFGLSPPTTSSSRSASRDSWTAIKGRRMGMRRATTQLLARHPHEKRARSAAFHRIELLALQRPVGSTPITQNGGLSVHLRQRTADQ